VQLPIQVVFRNMERSAGIEEVVRERAALLERYAREIISCRVVVDPAGKHHRHGNQYAVRVDVKIPGHEIAASRTPAAESDHTDLHAAIRDAFDAARRQIEDHVRRRRGAVKHHEEALRGIVSRLFPEEDYGFLTTRDGREIYFHRNSVLDGGFARLQPGCEVRFVEEQGEQGPQASTVRIA